MHIWILAVLHIFGQHPDAYSTQTSSKTPSYCKALVARDQDWETTWKCGGVELDSAHAQQGPLVSSSSTCSIVQARHHGSEQRLAMRDMPHHEQKAGGLLPKVWRLLATLPRFWRPILGMDCTVGDSTIPTKEQQCKEENQNWQGWRKEPRERQRCGKQRPGWKTCAFSICGSSLLATPDSWCPLATHGLRPVPADIFGIDNFESTSCEPIHTRVGECPQEGLPGICYNASAPTGCAGTSRTAGNAANHEGLACRNICFRTRQACAHRSSRSQKAAQARMDETLAREHSGLGVSARHLSSQLGQTAGCRSEGTTRSVSGQENDSTIELPVRRSCDGRDCAGGGDHGATSGQGRREASSTATRYNEILSVYCWHLQSGHLRDLRRRWEGRQRWQEEVMAGTS